MKIISFKKMSMPKMAVLATGAAVALMAGTMSPQVAQATPDQGTTCAGCHAAGATVSATPSTATPAAGAAYTVAIAITTTATGNSGFNISDAAGASITTGGPSAGSTHSASMTAPATAGTYVYTVSAAQGKPGAWGSATYTITVAGTATTTSTTPPATTTSTTTPPASSTSTSATTPPAITAPGAPTNVRATAGNGQVRLTWDAPKDDGGSPISGYLIVANDGEITWLTDGTETSGILTELTNGKSYTFVVMTFTDGSGAPSQQSAPSNAVTPTGASGPIDSGTTPVVPGGSTAVVPAGAPDTGAGGSAI